MTELFKTGIGRLRIVAFAEGVSFLLILFVTMPLKYLFAMPNANKVIGLLHGLLFVLYILNVIQVKIEHKWGFKTTALALLASIIPFGTFWFDAKFLKNGVESEELSLQNS
jgi:integral membrane protein